MMSDVLALGVTQNMIWSGGVWRTTDDDNGMSATPVVEHGACCGPHLTLLKELVLME